MSDEIDFKHFQRVDVRVGTVISAQLNTKARKAAYVLKVDFGELGIKTTSAQITENYEAPDLLGKQIVAIINFPVKLVAGVRSEVLVLAAVSEQNGTVLLQPQTAVENGAKVA
ncbi:tRNA-binding protein [bacterium]|nr:MAG: tRNA-binding protein [bacterium]